MRKSLVKDVIKYTHCSGNEKQKFNAYRQLLYLYDKHYHVMTDIITNLHKYSSYKAYLYILSLNKNEQLENLIFSILINTLKDDIAKCERNQETSNLAKWLPREGSHFDKSLNFVNRFVLKMYPELFVDEKNVKTNLNKAKKRYRGALAGINRRLGTLEVLISDGKEIEYGALSEVQTNKYFYKFMKENESEFVNYLNKKYVDMGVGILDRVYKDDIKHAVEKEICCFVWEDRKYEYYHRLALIFSGDCDLVVDITQLMYYEKTINHVLALILMFVEGGKLVFLNQKKVCLDDTTNIFDKIQKIKQCIQPEEIKIPCKSVNDTLYVVTTKTIDEIPSFENYGKIIVYNVSKENEDIFGQKQIFYK